MIFYLSFLNKFKWIILTLLLGTIIFLSLRIADLNFNGSYRIWFGKESSVLKSYDSFCATFGSDDSILVVFSDQEGIIKPKPLESIKHLSQEFATLPHVTRVNSILNYQYIHVSAEDEKDITVESFIEEPKKLSPQELKKRRDIALEDPMVRDYVLSKDGKTTIIAIKLSSFDEKTKAINIGLINDIQKILDKETQTTGYKYFISGTSVTDAALATIADHDALIYVPIAFFIIVVVLYLFFRTVLGVVIPVVTVIFGSIVTLSFYSFMGLELNNFSINIPIFITAIGIADAVHFYTSWVNLRYSGRTNIEAIHEAFGKNFLPMLLTTLTTAIGFGSLVTSDIVPMSTLGYTIALGSVTTLLFTLFFMPVFLLSLRKDYMPKPIKTARCLVREFNYAGFVVRHDKKIVLFSMLIAFGIGWGVVYTKFDSNSIKYFAPDVEVSQAAYYTMEHITGPSIYELIIDSNQDDGIKDPIFLAKVERFDKALKQNFSEIRYTSSLLDVIKRFQDVMNPSHLANETIGKTQEINAQYLLLYSLSLPQGMDINDKMDLKQRLLRMSIQADIVSSSRSLQIMKWSKEWWQNEGINAHIEGQVSMFAQMQDMVSQTFLNSLIQTFLVISILMFFILRNLKLLIIFLIPNLLPLLISIGFMGWMGIPINIGIAVAGVIVLGLAVDDTIYFFNKYSEARKYGLGAAQTFDYILEHSGSAMVFTTIILSSAFSVFLFSDFMPNVHFALMTISTMFLALLTDLLLSPALLSLLDKASFKK